MKRVIDVLYYILGILFNISFTIILIALVAVFAMSAFGFGQSIFVEYMGEREDYVVIVEITDGRDTMAVADILHEHGLIENRWLFVVQSRLNGSYRWFRNDTFALNMNMSSNQIMQALQEIPELPPGEEIRVTIPEGMTIAQVARETAALGLWTEAEFLEAVQGDFPHTFLRNVPQRANRLQGYLFPDTYNLPPNPTPEDLIIRMLNQFEHMFYSVFIQSPDAQFTSDEIVIIASIIEKEIRHHEERELASAVIHNRLARGLRLEMYSTVSYVVDRPRNQLTPQNMQFGSRFNTFIYYGLPPGPIAAPGLHSLQAAMFPAETVDIEDAGVTTTREVNYTRFVLREDGSNRHDFY